MSKIDRTVIDDLKNIFEDIYKIFIREKEDNWIRGIKIILSHLQEAENDNPDLDKIYVNVRTSYRSMNSGQGSFADFMIWKDDFDERAKVNQEFSVLANRAWEILEKY